MSILYTTIKYIISTKRVAVTLINSQLVPTYAFVPWLFYLPVFIFGFLGTLFSLDDLLLQLT